MSEVTVNQLATTVGIPVERLLAQLHEAGISASDGEARLSEQEKVQLLGYLRRSHGKAEPEGGTTAPSRVTLKRKSVSELRQPVASPRASGHIRAATAPRARSGASVPTSSAAPRPRRRKWPAGPLTRRRARHPGSRR